MKHWEPTRHRLEISAEALIKEGKLQVKRKQTLTGTNLEISAGCRLWQRAGIRTDHIYTCCRDEGSPTETGGFEWRKLGKGLFVWGSCEEEFRTKHYLSLLSLSPMAMPLRFYSPGHFFFPESKHFLCNTIVQGLLNRSDWKCRPISMKEIHDLTP